MSEEEDEAGSLVLILGLLSFFHSIFDVD